MKKENKQDANLGFKIRCKVADMVDLLEQPHRIVRAFSDEIQLDHLEIGYLATVKISIKKKQSA